MPRADRLFALVQLISGPGRRSLDELARALETSPRSIYRDLADLESRGVPIERDGGRYRLVEGSAVRPLLFTDRERILLTILLENPHLETQTAWRAPLRELRAKLSSIRSSDPVVAALAGPDRSGAIAEEVEQSIEHAIRGSHSISFLYSSLSSRKTEWRGIDPWMLLHRSEAWYLIGRCHVHDEPRTFRLDRIRAVLPIGTSFEPPKEFDAARWFERSWGVYASSETHDVRILFDASVAPLIENAHHHPGEEKNRREDGRIEYRARIGPLDEIARWIVGFEGKSVAIAPDELVARVRAIAEGAAAAHPAQRPRRAAARTIRAPRDRTDGN